MIAPDHIHIWSPIPGQRARYRCTCGATARRYVDSGRLVIDRHRYATDAAPAVQPQTHIDEDGHGRIPRRRGRS